MLQSSWGIITFLYFILLLSLSSISSLSFRRKTSYRIQEFRHHGLRENQVWYTFSLLMGSSCLLVSFRTACSNTSIVGFQGGHLGSELFWVLRYSRFGMLSCLESLACCWHLPWPIVVLEFQGLLIIALGNNIF